MNKKFTLKTSDREPRPRSERLRGLGGGAASGNSGSTVVNVSGGQPVVDPNSHTHANKSDLDKFSADTEGYAYLTQMREVEEIDDDGNPHRNWASVKDKVKAGYADKAGVAHDLDEDSPIRKQFLSRLADDVAKGHITFEQGITALLTSYLRGGAHFGNFVKGLAGAIIDQVGNSEFESITSRSYLKVFELIYNRLNALEGTTSFADVGTIDAVEEGENGSQVLTMRKRWAGDFTAFQPGDIVYGYVNNLSNGTQSEYFRAWAWIKSVNRAANTLTVVPYPDAEVPGGANHPLREAMIITRWGNNIEANAYTYANKEYSAVIVKRGDNDYANVRQSTFYISCEDGNIVELMGVNKPILEPGNYGTVLGKMPVGLLDRKTQELINKDQPYLFARGIIVQDLIRIDYEGNVTRTANYRGTWNLATAASATDYYRSTAGVYDTVTWNGDLWQCVANGTTDEPSETTGSWVNMTGSKELPTLNVWSVIPSDDIITLRYAEDGHVTITPSSVSCQVLLTSTEGTQTFNSSLDLREKGVTLYYSLDGATWKEFIIGAAEPLELEDSTGVIETEKGDDVLTLGGDDVNASQIGDRLYFELRDTDNVLARAIVPIVKDGKNGREGVDGLIVYPAGYFNPEATYSATDETTPVVKYGENFYVLKRGKTYTAAVMPDNRKTPAGDVAYGGEDSRWQLFDKFNAIYTDIIMAEFAKLGGAVFFGEYMFSQNGTLNGMAVSGVDENGQAYYKQFKDGVTYGTFIPNLMLNFITGQIIANNASIKGEIDAESGKIGGFNINYGYIGVNTDLNYGDNAGMSLFPSFIKFSNNDWSHFAAIGTNVLPSIYGLYAQARFENTEQNTFGTNYGILVYAENAENNIAMKAVGNVVSDSLNTSYGYRPISMITNTVVHRPYDANTWIIKSNVDSGHICLPDRADVQNKLGISSTSPFSVRITIIADASNTKNFKIQGRNNSTIFSLSDDGKTKVYFLDRDIYPYRLNNNGQQQLGDGPEMGAGDIVEYQLVYNGSTYNAYLLNQRN